MSPLIVCDTCGAVATMFARDIQRTDAPGATWMTFAPRGPLKAGCDRHPVYAYEFDRDGRRRGRLSDDEGRPIPLSDWSVR
jgi:hypothetical protein